MMSNTITLNLNDLDSSERNFKELVISETLSEEELKEQAAKIKEFQNDVSKLYNWITSCISIMEGTRITNRKEVINEYKYGEYNIQSLQIHIGHKGLIVNIIPIAIESLQKEAVIDFIGPQGRKRIIRRFLNKNGDIEKVWQVYEVVYDKIQKKYTGNWFNLTKELLFQILIDISIHKKEDDTNEYD